MKKSNALAIATFIAIVVSVFWIVRTDNYEFLQLDDIPYVTNNPMVRNGLTAEGIVWSLKNTKQGQNWHPVTWMSLMLDATLLGDDNLPALSMTMHRHNAIVHGLSAALLFLLILALARRIRWFFPLALAILWALHPLRAECVCWVTERKELLCSLFSLLSLLLWLHPQRTFRIAAITAYALALLSKSVAVTLPVAMIALDFLRDEDDWRTVIKKRWWIYTLLFVLGGIASLCTLASQHDAINENVGTATLVVRLGNAVGAYATHLKNTIAPVGLYFHHQFVNHIRWFLFVPGLALVGTMLYSAFAFLRSGRCRIGFLAAAWIGAGLLPMCGIIRVGIEMDPDRFGHWIGAGLTVIIALLLERLTDRRVQAVVGALLSVLVVGTAVAGWNYAASFKNNLTVFLRTLSVDPDHPNGLAQVATEYFRRYNDKDTAIRCFERSLSLRQDENVAVQLVTVLSMRGRPEDYRRIFSLCARIDTDHSLDEKGAALTALGIAYMHQYNWTKAISCFEDAIPRQRTDPKLQGDPGPIEDNLMRVAMCYLNAKKISEAKERLKALIRARNPQIAAKAQEILLHIQQTEALGPRVQ